MLQPTQSQLLTTDKCDGSIDDAPSGKYASPIKKSTRVLIKMQTAKLKFRKNRYPHE